MWSKIKPYVISILIALGVGALSALITKNNMNLVYEQVNKPPLSPPMALFPVVWCILFVLMGISSAIIYINRNTNPEIASSALKLYGVQLVFNFLWPIAFFNFQAFLFAFIWIMVLWVLIIAMIVQFNKINKTAGYLQIPYLVWTTFAAYLNLMIYILNR